MRYVLFQLNKLRYTWQVFHLLTGQAEYAEKKTLVQIPKTKYPDCERSKLSANLFDFQYYLRFAELSLFIVCFENPVLSGCVVIIISKIMTTQIPL